MSRTGKLAPEVNRALFVKNLSYNVTTGELFELFGKFGAIRQVRQGFTNNTKGTAYVVFEDVMDAKQACDKLNGFNFQNRYLVVLYHQPEKMAKSKEDLAARKENLAQLKKQHGIDCQLDGPADNLQMHRQSVGPSSSSPPTKSVGFKSPTKGVSVVKKKPSVAAAPPVRGVMPHFIRKLLPTVPEVS